MFGSLTPSQTDDRPINQFLRWPGGNTLHDFKPPTKYYSDHAKLCLEGSFTEAGTNAVWFPDVDPDVFQWL